MNTYVQISSATTSSLVYVNFEIAGGKLKLQLLSGALPLQEIKVEGQLLSREA